MNGTWVTHNVCDPRDVWDEEVGYLSPTNLSNS